MAREMAAFTGCRDRWAKHCGRESRPGRGGRRAETCYARDRSHGARLRVVSVSISPAQAGHGAEQTIVAALLRLVLHRGHVVNSGVVEVDVCRLDSWWNFW